ncbi:hypothetical protein OTU49_003371, partial [Cherax quadricarinatus]
PNLCPFILLLTFSFIAMIYYSFCFDSFQLLPPLPKLSFPPHPPLTLSYSFIYPLSSYVSAIYPILTLSLSLLCILTHIFHLPPSSSIVSSPTSASVPLLAKK